MKSFCIAVLALMLTLGGAGLARAAQAQEVFATGGGLRLLGDGPHYLNLSAGVFEYNDDQDESAAGQIEWRFGGKLGFVGPLLGVMANADGGVIGYAGLYLDLAAGPFVLTPQTGVGAYEQGSSQDLGGTLEFISGATLAYQFDNLARLGVRYEHISNADLHDENPGGEVLLVNLGIPF
jgi:hypothetical protein